MARLSGVRGGVSREALEVLGAGDAVDLHVDSFIWTRILGYDLHRRHGTNVLGNRLLGQADIPRMVAGGLTGAVLSITTNPFRPAAARRRAFLANLERLSAVVGRDGSAAPAAGAASYRAARAAGRLACFVAVQGGNALAAGDLADPRLDAVSRVTLVHLTRSALGASSAPGGRGGGLTPAGATFVEALRDRSIVLDLAHASPATFDAALAVHGGDRPVAVTHTGARAVHDHWRNLDDDRIRAVAATGGVVGTILHRAFLAPLRTRVTSDDVARHVAHVVRVGGEDTAALGTDFDGLILPPADLRTVVALPRLVQRLLDRGFRAERIHKVLGANYLRVMEAVRPDR